MNRLWKGIPGKHLSEKMEAATLDEKRKARLKARGINVLSITPELAEKWGTLISPGPRRGRSKPNTPNKIQADKPSAHTPPDGINTKKGGVRLCQ